MYNNIMTEKFILLTEDDFNNYLKLKQHHENNNIYHKNYLKKTYEDTKINNPEKYKTLMQKQNELNKTYKKKALEQLKQDEQKYNEYRLKINEYNKQVRIKRKENLKNAIVAT